MAIIRLLEESKVVNGKKCYRAIVGLGSNIWFPAENGLRPGVYEY